MAELRRLRIGNGGWVQVTLSDGVVAHLRLTLADDGKLELDELYMHQRLTTDVLRSLPLGQITAACNASPEAESIKSKLRIPAPDLERLVSYFATTFGSGKVDHWIAQSFRAQREGSGVEQPPRREDPHEAPRARTPRRTLKAPAGARYPDSFYEKVAEQYLAAAAASARPAAELAERSDVPVSTVHRWVKEARRRGLLPRGRRGG